MTDPAIEAALHQWFDVPREDMDDFDTRMRAAITAYLKVSGVGRDAERYRFLKGNFGICRPFDELLIWHPDEIDAAIDAARGGERG